MALHRIKWGITLAVFLIALPQCSDFNAIFNGKPSPKVAQRSKKSPKKQRNRKVPRNAKNYFAWPLSAPISSVYGPRRGRFHEGVDIDGETGDPVEAAAAGTVVYSNRLGGYGRLIVVRHDNGFFTAYAHNKKNLVKKGKKVRKGQRIAVVGSSGKTTGDHLHFEIRDERGTYDPLDLLPRRRYSRRK